MESTETTQPLETVAGTPLGWCRPRKYDGHDHNQLKEDAHALTTVHAHHNNKTVRSLLEEQHEYGSQLQSSLQQGGRSPAKSPQLQNSQLLQKGLLLVYASLLVPMWKRFIGTAPRSFVRWE